MPHQVCPRATPPSVLSLRSASRRCLVQSFGRVGTNLGRAGTHLGRVGWPRCWARSHASRGSCSASVSTYMYPHVCIYVYMYICLYIYTYIYISSCIHIFIYIYIDANVYIIYMYVYRSMHMTVSLLEACLRSGCTNALSLRERGQCRAWVASTL